MTINNITPDAAHKLMTGAPAHRYLDVRTTEEFAAGHAEGAINVPVAFMTGAGMQMNPDFLRVVEAALPKDTPLVVGCMAGGRSSRACEVLDRAGYTALHNIDGGFGGRRDPSGRVVQKGWVDLGLPVSKDTSAGTSYESLKARVK